MQVFHRVHVPAPPKVVFAVLCDVELHPQWQASAQSSRWTSPAPRGRESTFSEVHRVMGFTVHHGFAVTAWEPERLLAYECRDGMHPVQITHRVEPTATGSVIEFELRSPMTGLMGLSAPLARRLIRRWARADFARLVQLVERQQLQAAG